MVALVAALAFLPYVEGPGVTYQLSSSSC